MICLPVQLCADQAPPGTPADQITPVQSDDPNGLCYRCTDGSVPPQGGSCDGCPPGEFELTDGSCGPLPPGACPSGPVGWDSDDVYGTLSGLSAVSSAAEPTLLCEGSVPLTDDGYPATPDNTRPLRGGDAVLECDTGSWITRASRCWSNGCDPGTVPVVWSGEADTSDGSDAIPPECTPDGDLAFPAGSNGDLASFEDTLAPSTGSATFTCSPSADSALLSTWEHTTSACVGVACTPDEIQFDDPAAPCFRTAPPPLSCCTSLSWDSIREMTRNGPASPGQVEDGGYLNQFTDSSDPQGTDGARRIGFSDSGSGPYVSSLSDEGSLRFGVAGSLGSSGEVVRVGVEYVNADGYRSSVSYPWVVGQLSLDFRYNFDPPDTVDYGPFYTQERAFNVTHRILVWVNSTQGHSCAYYSRDNDSLPGDRPVPHLSLFPSGSCSGAPSMSCLAGNVYWDPLTAYGDLDGPPGLTTRTTDPSLMCSGSLSETASGESQVVDNGNTDRVGQLTAECVGGLWNLTSATCSQICPAGDVSWSDSHGYGSLPGFDAPLGTPGSGTHLEYCFGSLPTTDTGGSASTTHDPPDPSYFGYRSGTLTAECLDGTWTVSSTSCHATHCPATSDLSPWAGSDRTSCDDDHGGHLYRSPVGSTAVFEDTDPPSFGEASFVCLADEDLPRNATWQVQSPPEPTCSAPGCSHDHGFGFTDPSTGSSTHSHGYVGSHRHSWAVSTGVGTSYSNYGGDDEGCDDGGPVAEDCHHYGGDHGPHSHGYLTTHTHSLWAEAEGGGHPYDSDPAGDNDGCVTTDVDCLHGGSSHVSPGSSSPHGHPHSTVHTHSQEIPGEPRLADTPGPARQSGAVGGCIADNDLRVR